MTCTRVERKRGRFEMTGNHTHRVGSSFKHIHKYFSREKNFTNLSIDHTKERTLYIEDEISRSFYTNTHTGETIQCV